MALSAAGILVRGTWRDIFITSNITVSKGHHRKSGEINQKKGHKDDVPQTHSANVQPWVVTQTLRSLMSSLLSEKIH